MTQAYVCVDGLAPEHVAIQLDSYNYVFLGAIDLTIGSACPEHDQNVIYIIYP